MEEAGQVEIVISAPSVSEKGWYCEPARQGLVTAFLFALKPVWRRGPYSVSLTPVHRNVHAFHRIWGKNSHTLRERVWQDLGGLSRSQAERKIRILLRVPQSVNNEANYLEQGGCSLADIIWSVSVFACLQVLWPDTVIQRVVTSPADHTVWHKTLFTHRTHM